MHYRLHSQMQRPITSRIKIALGQVRRDTSRLVREMRSKEVSETIASALEGSSANDAESDFCIADCIVGRLDAAYRDCEGAAAV